MCFTGSIGSFGAEAPRHAATARWLIENPTLDPCPDYGRQKRACRELMAAFRHIHEADTRFAVFPGVLHTEVVWGKLDHRVRVDALLTAAHHATKHGLFMADAFICPIDPYLRFLMIFVSDLMWLFVALHEADARNLNEPHCGYAVPVLYLSPIELFAEVRKHHSGFGYRLQLNKNMNKFANLWPNDLGTTEALRDPGYPAEVKLPEMVTTVFSSDEDRNRNTAEAFKALDSDGSLVLNRAKPSGLSEM